MKILQGQGEILKHRSLTTPRKFIDTPYKDIRLAIQNYISPKQRVLTLEKSKFVSLIQVVVESEHNFIARLREEARYCDFKKIQSAANPEA